MPMHPVNKPVGYTYVLHRQHKDTPLSSRTRSGASGLLMMTEHAGTHIDALCHQALDHRLNGDVAITPKVETPYGFTKHGIEKVDPIVTRGVLLDVASSKNTERLPERYGVSLSDLRQCCEVQGTRIERGDVVIVRTGYGRLRRLSEAYQRAAGVSLEATKWLSSKGVVAVGADNMPWDLNFEEPDQEMGVTLPCHAHLIVQKGIFIIENLNLEELASDKVYEFLFVCSPLKLVGATGSPVRPLAITGLEMKRKN
jgi:kynurenine formamidase